MNENLFDSLKGLEGIKIGLFLSDNQYVEGTLLHVQEDHLTVKVLENIFYFPINQIKAISKNAKDSKVMNEQLSNGMTISEELLEERLNNMRMRWVTINSFDNQTFTGVLNKISDDHVMLLNGDTQYFIGKSHITNIFEGFIKQNNQSNEKENDSNNQSTEENVNSSQTTLQNDEKDNLNLSNNSPSDDNRSNESAHNDFLQIQEVKFNSPMQGCTWNTKKFSNVRNNNSEINNESDLNKNIDCQNERKVNIVETTEIQEDQRLNMNDNEENTNEQEPFNEQPPEENQAEQNIEQANEQEERVLTMEDNRKLIESQYYALMKFAKRMNALEEQYETLMKHAEKMYLQLRKRRNLI